MPSVESEEPWWLQFPELVVVRIARKGQPERFVKAEPHQLQQVLDKAAREWSDLSKPCTPPIPESLLQGSDSRQKSARPMAGSTGRGRRAR